MFGTSSNTGGGLFGASNANNNSSGGGLFGNKPATSTNTGFGFGQSNTTGQANTTGGLFGQSQNNNTNAQSGGLFGSNQQKPAGGGLFGQSTNTGGFGASNSGSTFGKPAGTSTTGGGLFGGQQQGSNTGGLFGGNQQSSNTTGGGLFGSTNQQSTNTGASGGLFGNKQQNTGTSGGLFGNTQQNNTGTSGGLFGNNQQQNNTNTGGLFGGNQQSTASGGLFGNKTNAPATGGLFGSNNTQQTGGLFGANNNNAQQSGGLFGQPSQQSTLFSNTTNNQQPSFSWSQPQQQQQQPAVNNVTTLGGFGQNSNQPQNTNPAAYIPAVNDQLAKVYEQWDPNSTKCALKTHLYNKFSDQEMNVLMSQPRPANETPEDWDKAMTERPGQNFYPIKITSYDEVAQRIETQLDYAGKEKIVLNQINERLNTLSAKHDLENTTRILKAKTRHTQLSRRVLRLATVLAMLKLKGYPLLPEEEEIAKQFDILTTKLNDPNSPIGRVGDIFAKMAILKERAEEMNTQFDKSIHVLNESFDNGVVTKGKTKEDVNNPKDVIEKISQILVKQQMGLNYLNEVLRKDEEKVEKLISSRK
ncbi:NUP57 [Candida metapsilosis]|uniref:NUP57 n=1 Tax=Candida metapsilosis TaxID=273372 RepID=A0A8H7ZAA6_9ASCO|nr:NUP57 [Candida metapsilosis]